MTVDLAAQLVADRSRDLIRAAEATRLAALARCCRPSTWRRAAVRLGEALVESRRVLPLRRDAGCCVAA